MPFVCSSVCSRLCRKRDGNVLTALDAALVGALSGVIEVCLQQPTVALKNALQAHRRVPLNPFSLYRGLIMYVSFHVLVFFLVCHSFALSACFVWCCRTVMQYPLRR